MAVSQSDYDPNCPSLNMFTEWLPDLTLTCCAALFPVYYFCGSRGQSCEDKVSRKEILQSITHFIFVYLQLGCRRPGCVASHAAPLLGVAAGAIPWNKLLFILELRSLLLSTKTMLLPLAETRKQAKLPNKASKAQIKWNQKVINFYETLDVWLKVESSERVSLFWQV